MPKFVFTEQHPQFIIRRTVPFELRFQMTGTPEPGVQTRLWHIRTGPGKARDTQIAEGKAGSNPGTYVIERSGKGLKNRPAGFDPIRMSLPADGVHIVRYGFEPGVVEVNGQKGTVELNRTGGVEIVFGFDLLDAELKAPIGMTIDADFAPAGNEQPAPAPPPVTPPAPEPPSPPVNPPQQGPAPPQSPGTGSARDALIADITAALAKYQAARGADPTLVILASALFAYLRNR